MDNLVMEVTNYYAINKARIEINKINVVGGVNSSGKSTLSRLFYSLLKGNSTNRRDYVLQSLIDDINETIDNMNYESNEFNLPNHLKITDNYSYIQRKYEEVLKIYEQYEKMALIKMNELNKEKKKTLNNLTEKLENNGFDVDEIIAEYKSPCLNDYSKSPFSEDLNENLKELDAIMNIFSPIDSFCLKMANFLNIFDLYVFMDGMCIPWGNEDVLEYFVTEEIQEYLKDINRIDDLQNQWGELYVNIGNLDPWRLPIFQREFKTRWDVFFDKDSPDLSKESLRAICKKEHILGDAPYGVFFELYLNFIDSKIDAFDYFFHNSFISSVYYLDNLSIIDLSDIITKDKFLQLFHNNEIIDDLYKNRVFEINFKSDIFQKQDFAPVLNEDLNLDQDVKNILEKIENIIQGNYYGYDSNFSSNKNIKNQIINPNLPFHSFNTASGIKQIGIIQLLLRGNKLKKDGFLIIDEPEVNLHPDWQFKFAEIIVLLAKDLNITIYLNSHSPFFIESIDAFTEFYDMQEEINYYLSEESENKGKYNFTKIGSDELYKIYDNLGKPYDLIDQLRLEKHLGD